MRKEGEEKQDTGEKKKEKRARSLIRRKPLALQKKKKKPDRPRQVLREMHHQALQLPLVGGADLPVEVLRPLL